MSENIWVSISGIPHHPEQEKRVGRAFAAVSWPCAFSNSKDLAQLSQREPPELLPSRHQGPYVLVFVWNSKGGVRWLQHEVTAGSINRIGLSCLEIDQCCCHTLWCVLRQFTASCFYFIATFFCISSWKSEVMCNVNRCNFFKNQSTVVLQKKELTDIPCINTTSVVWQLASWLWQQGSQRPLRGPVLQPSLKGGSFHSSKCFLKLQ